MFFTYYNNNRLIKARNRKLFAFSFLFLFPFLFACSKRMLEERPTQAALQVFNALDNGEHIYVNLSGNRPSVYNHLVQLGNKEYLQNKHLLFLNKLPGQADIYTTKDTLPHQSPVVSAALDLKPGAIYSFFIYGEKSAAGYSLFNDNIPPVNRQDSTTHIRIANFSEAQSISVNIQGKPVGSLVQNLSYKSLSDFTELDADKAVAGYTFEIRNAQTDVVLATYTTTNFQATTINSLWLAKSNTLVFTGKPAAANPNNQKITLMNHR